MGLSILDFSVICCENFDNCDGYPVLTEKADKRTKEDKTLYYVTCQEQLANWIREQVLKEEEMKNNK